MASRPLGWLSVVVVVLVAACSGGGATVSEDARVAGASGLQAEHAAALVASNGQYLVAEGGGGGAVNANRPARGPWESFTLVDENGGALEDGDVVHLETSDGAHWLSALGGGGGVVTASRSARGPWETFTLESDSGASPTPAPTPGPTPTPSPSTGGVLPEDTVLVPPQSQGAVLGTITGYEMNSPCPFADPATCELPLYLSYDRDDPEWWDILVQELVASHVNVAMMHGRGCYDATSGDSGNGNMCPRLLRNLIAAIDRAGVRDVLRLGMFDDTGAYQGTRDTVENRPQAERFDLADHASFRFFWDHNMKVWFDTVPKDLWYRLNGRPVVAFWSLSSYFFANQRGNASALLRTLRANFQARYGEDPVFIVDDTWITEDPTITTSDAQGRNAWFDPNRNVSTITSWGGATWGAAVPGYRNPSTLPGCGASCREQGRRDGATFRNALTQAQSTRFTLLEGWTNVAESAGTYRSAAWSYPNQYINLVREFADPNVTTLKLEAEAADAFTDFSPSNLGGTYRPGALDVGRLREPQGWFVGWTEGGESLTFKDLALPCGTYRFTGRFATPLDGQTVHLQVGSTVMGSTVASKTGSWDSYGLVHLGELKVPAGRDDVTLVFESGGVNVDWIFVRRVSSICH